MYSMKIYQFGEQRMKGESQGMERALCASVNPSLE